MFSRRNFLAAGAATLATPAFAQGYQLPEQYYPRIARLADNLPAGEIHVDPTTYNLYLTMPNNEALVYTVGIGRANLYERGTFTVGAKKQWPSWTPTPDMIEREPETYKEFEDGMEGGPANPLGARALYLFQPGRGDTFLRIHGTNAPRTLASAVSNGCVRLLNSHISDLYQRVPLGTRVVLH